MIYTYHKKKYPDDILVYIESFNKELELVLFDFIDSNEFSLFSEFAGLGSNLTKPSMVLLKKYKQRTIRKNTIYAIKKDVILKWREQYYINVNDNGSLIIGFTIELNDFNEKIFSESVSLDDYDDFRLNYLMTSRGDQKNIPLDYEKELSVTIRNVGQGNWNEIKSNGKTILVYDIGASMYAKGTDISNYLKLTNQDYKSSKPGLVLSHWDIDHYHCFVGMSDEELSNFSLFICRDKILTLTGRKVFAKISNAIGLDKTYSISAHRRDSRGGPTRLIPLNAENKQIVIYNAQDHKDRNISGLVISVKTSESSIVLSGDCHYSQISDYILPSLNYSHNHYLIAPHHGGKAGKFKYKIPYKAIPKTAIISVGTNNYGHPDQKYIDNLKSHLFEIKETQKEQCDITINL